MTIPKSYTFHVAYFARLAALVVNTIEYITFIMVNTFDTMERHIFLYSFGDESITENNIAKIYFPT